MLKSTSWGKTSVINLTGKLHVNILMIYCVDSQIYVYICIYTCLYVHVYIQKYKYIPVCIYIYIYMHTGIYLYFYMQTCTYRQVYIHIYTYIYESTQYIINIFTCNLPVRLITEVLPQEVDLSILCSFCLPLFHNCPDHDLVQKLSITVKRIKPLVTVGVGTVFTSHFLSQPFIKVNPQRVLFLKRPRAATWPVRPETRVCSTRYDLAPELPLQLPPECCHLNNGTENNRIESENKNCPVCQAEQVAQWSLTLATCWPHPPRTLPRPCPHPTTGSWGSLRAPWYS